MILFVAARDDQSFFKSDVDGAAQSCSKTHMILCAIVLQQLVMFCFFSCFDLSTNVLVRRI